MEKRRIWDMIAQLPLICGFLAVAGLASYFLSLMVCWLLNIQFPELSVTYLLFASSAPGFVLAVVLMWLFMHKVGSNDAAFVLESGGSSPGWLPAACVMVISLGVYGFVQWLFSLFRWIFFSGPSHFFAFGIYLCTDPGDSYAALDALPIWSRALSYVLYALVILPFMYLGYYRGFKRSVGSK